LVLSLQYAVIKGGERQLANKQHMLQHKKRGKNGGNVVQRSSPTPGQASTSTWMGDCLQAK